MNLQEGKLNIDSQIISKGTDKTDFITLFSQELNAREKNEICTCRFKLPKKIGKLDFWVTIKFVNSTIRSIVLKNADPNLENSYDNWSDERFEKERESHDNWVISQLGAPHEKSDLGIEYHFIWGNIFSYFEPRSPDTGILINYKIENQ